MRPTAPHFPHFLNRDENQTHFTYLVSLCQTRESKVATELSELVPGEFFGQWLAHVKHYDESFLNKLFEKVEYTPIFNIEEFEYL